MGLKPDREASPSAGSSSDVWLEELAGRVPALASLLNASPSQQIALGYRHTLREICQQPSTWLETCENALERRAALARAVYDTKQAAALVLTGSGSSLYAGDCLVLPLQGSLGVPVVSLSGGQLLTDGIRVLPPCTPRLIVSFARSGNSPESCGVVDHLLEEDPSCRHLAITCNRTGKLATSYDGNPRVTALTLADRTCDRSLVMTSSFTNMVLAGLSLAYLEEPAEYRRVTGALASAARALLLSHTGCLAAMARKPFTSAVFLASGPSFGAARESALKLLESTSGRVRAFPETYLGLRHGPMAAVHDDTLLVCFLSSNPLVRAYEFDLIEELDRKKLGLAKVIVGDEIPTGFLNPQDLAVACPGMAAAGDDAAPVVHVLAGQLMAFFRCMHEGLHPDAPSVDGVISRVVENFFIHRSLPSDGEADVRQVRPPGPIAEEFD
ncbi:MAG TPA: tagatose-6-phosphate ketose isomerase [Verrucomicrobiae bacterium]|nr:tagatose-6-phosphate ketose isomerase [Verrucomicrobiae bacterium]